MWRYFWCCMKNHDVWNYDDGRHQGSLLFGCRECEYRHSTWAMYNAES